MRIKIEIDVEPDELRRFLGLPDVAGFQEDLIQFLREKVGAASDNFDPASFVRDNLQSLRQSSAWQKIVAAAKTKTSRAKPRATRAKQRATAKKAPPRRSKQTPPPESAASLPTAK